jgi:hypothetical protein
MVFTLSINLEIFDYIMVYALCKTVSSVSSANHNTYQLLFWSFSEHKFLKKKKTQQATCLKDEVLKFSLTATGRNYEQFRWYWPWHLIIIYKFDQIDEADCMFIFQIKHQYSFWIIDISRKLLSLLVGVTKVNFMWCVFHNAQWYWSDNVCKLVTDQWRASLGVRDSESCWFFFIPELWDFIHQIVGDFSYVAL